MSRRLLLRLLLGTFLLGVTGFYLWAFEADRGTEVCARCGAQREVVSLGDVHVIAVPVETPARDWAEAHVGRCREHGWHRSGCWQRGGTVSCTMIPDGHSLLLALARLNDEAATDLARRFESLSEERRVELWRMANRLEDPDSVPSHEREVARAVAEKAGWDDLAAAWPPRSVTNDRHR
jgi:hypothetical protein